MSNEVKRYKQGHVMSERMQGVDCPLCENKEEHKHSIPQNGEVKRYEWDTDDMYENPEGAWVNLGAHEEAMAKLEQQLKDVLDRESAATVRHDEKVAKLEQELSDERDYSLALANTLESSHAQHLQEVDRLTENLAECYRISGADPDDDKDFRLAPLAVREVKRLREESDESDAEIAKLEQRNAVLVKAVQDLIDHELPIFDRGPTGKRWDKVIATLKQNGGE